MNREVRQEVIKVHQAHSAAIHANHLRPEEALHARRAEPEDEVLGVESESEDVTLDGLRSEDQLAEEVDPREHHDAGGQIEDVHHLWGGEGAVVSTCMRAE